MREKEAFKHTHGPQHTLRLLRLLSGQKYFIYTQLQHRSYKTRPPQLTDTRLGTSEAKAGDHPLLIRLGAFRRGLCSVDRPSARGLPKFEVCRRLPCRPRETGAALSSATRPGRTCCPHPRLSLLGTGRRLFRGEVKVRSRSRTVVVQ